MIENADSKNDFVNAIAEQNYKDKELTSIFPSQEDLVDPTKPIEDSEIKLPQKKYTCHYGNFDLSHEGDRIECEVINNKCMHGGWLLAGEERTATKEGNMFIMLKWLVPEEEIKKSKDGLDEHTERPAAKEENDPTIKK
jgi:hypothetical protein